MKTLLLESLSEALNNYSKSLIIRRNLGNIEKLRIHVFGNFSRDRTNNNQTILKKKKVKFF